MPERGSAEHLHHSATFTRILVTAADLLVNTAVLERTMPSKLVRSLRFAAVAITLILTGCGMFGSASGGGSVGAGPGAATGAEGAAGANGGTGGGAAGGAGIAGK